MKTRIRIEVVAALLLATAPSLAQAPPSETLKAVLAKGAAFTVGGDNYEFIARPDGSYTDRAGAKKGSYRVDGKSLCLTPVAYPQESCLMFPDGKSSGAQFDIQGDRGPVAVTIY